MNNISSAAEYYKEVLKQDNTHVEAIACIGSNHFYSDQPEIALRFYRCASQSICRTTFLWNIGETVMKMEWQHRERMCRPCLYDTKNSNTRCFTSIKVSSSNLEIPRYLAPCRNTPEELSFNTMSLYELAVLSSISNSLIVSGSSSHHYCLCWYHYL